jgi:hypothetical protein
MQMMRYRQDPTDSHSSILKLAYSGNSHCCKHSCRLMH